MDRWETALWKQYASALDMLEDTLRACPPALWQARLYHEPELPGIADFWYVAFHCLFWLDFYLSADAEGFAPPAPFTLDEFNPAGKLPERVYTPEELLAYAQYGRAKCKARLETLADPFAIQRCRPDWPRMTVAELLIDNLRHVQEHAAQLRLFLGQQQGSAPDWITNSKRL